MSFAWVPDREPCGSSSDRTASNVALRVVSLGAADRRRRVAPSKRRKTLPRCHHAQTSSGRWRRWPYNEDLPPGVHEEQYLQAVVDSHPLPVLSIYSLPHLNAVESSLQLLPQRLVYVNCAPRLGTLARQNRKQD